jgi:hypothetical protein
MAEQTIKIIERPKSRVLIVRRADGAFTYRTQSLERNGWGPMGLDAGIYDSAETAENEARLRVWWLGNG